jgi:hypothetical protein
MDCFAALAMTASSAPFIHGHQNVDARDKPGHDVVFVDGQREIKNYAWLATVLPSAACAAARRAIGTR